MKTIQFDSNHFLSGIKSATGIAIGYLPIGMTYGILARTGGLSLFETVAMSLIVYAGASQFVALNLIAMGVNPVQIVFTVFMVNLRHFLMSTSLSEKIGKNKPYLEAVYSFGVTDETFAVSSLEEGEISPSFMFGLTSLAYLSWATSSGAGYLLGRGLPSVLKQGMSIALYALFIGLLVPSARKNKTVLLIAGLSGGLNSGLRLILSTGWSLVVASLTAALFGSLFFARNRETSQSGGPLDDD